MADAFTSSARSQAFSRLDRRAFVEAPTPELLWARMKLRSFRLWQEKRGEAEPKDLSGNLIVELGVVTEDLNRLWFEANTGLRHERCPAAGLPSGPEVDGGDPGWGRREQRGRVRIEVHAALVLLGRECRRKCMAQLQHNMWVIQSRSAVLSIITGGGKWVELTIAADALYQHVLLVAEKSSAMRGDGERPSLFGVEAPGPAFRRSALSI